jgi:preprotein translocase subunit SecE
LTNAVYVKKGEIIILILCVIVFVALLTLMIIGNEHKMSIT